MLTVTIPLLDELATMRFGADLLSAIDSVEGPADTVSGADKKQAMCMYLLGDLGVGKTTLSRGVLRAAGHKDAVKSPTYTLVEPYVLPRGLIYHFDLYRLSDPYELEFLGVEQYFDEGLLCLIEWPSKGGDFIPAADLTITLSEVAQSECPQNIQPSQMEQRLLVVAGNSALGDSILNHFIDYGSERWNISVSRHEE